MAGKLASRVRGLSEAQFRKAYGTEAQCRDIQRDKNEDETEEPENAIVHGAPPFAGIRS